MKNNDRQISEQLDAEVFEFISADQLVYFKGGVEIGRMQFDNKIKERHIILNVRIVIIYLPNISPKWYDMMFIISMVGYFEYLGTRRFVGRNRMEPFAQKTCRARASIHHH